MNLSSNSYTLLHFINVKYIEKQHRKSYVCECIDCHFNRQIKKSKNSFIKRKSEKETLKNLEKN